MVECLPGGEVSGHLHDVAEVGDVFELRGPIGGWFTWSGEARAVCLAGGSGVVPFVSMLRHAAGHGLTGLLRLVAVGRTFAELPYAAELLDAGAFVALTRENLGDRVAAPAVPGRARRARRGRRTGLRLWLRRLRELRHAPPRRGGRPQRCHPHRAVRRDAAETG